jgi:DhnA family fructose-bisphosphate aldolase class Ia
MPASPPGRRGNLPVGVRSQPATGGRTPLRGPAVILAADHRARGVITVEPYSSYLGALRAALAHCDGILASVQPLSHLSRTTTAKQRTYLSLNRTGLAGSSFELDDRLVTTVARASAEGCTGIKHMTRIDLTDPHTAGALELLGRVLEECRLAGLEALVEAVSWRDGKMARDADSIVYAAVVAHDMGAPVLKVPIPDEAPGPARVEAIARVVLSVGVPVLFLGGPRPPMTDPSELAKIREVIMLEVRDVMVGGAAGLAIGRAVINDPEPGMMAKEVADLVHSYGH